MKLCPRCNTQLDDAAAFCTSCGTQFIPNATVPQQPYVYPEAPKYVDPSDHTAEFDAQDISDNKVFAILPYLMSFIGIIIALLATRDSKFTMFHIRQALKIEVCNILLSIIAVVLAITILVPVAAGVCAVILFFVRIICFFRACSGKAIDAPIVGKLSFLK
ncbi:MAG: zinc-ribbon domain-containing protein [Ruminococcaceae bacterium]|nr:zinc-ribbon domain-containing protein [Oscillospiraceae bacterium]